MSDQLQTRIQEYDQIDAEIQELTRNINANPAKRLVPLVRNKGVFRGEVKYLTKAEFRKYTGKDINPAAVNAQGRIPWEYALDQIDRETGAKDSEDLKEKIEAVRRDMDRVAELKEKRRELAREIGAALPEKPRVESVRTEAKAPVFPKHENTRAVVTTAPSTEIVARRNPPFWQVEVDDTGTEKKPDVTLRVRYKKEADGLARAAARDAIEEHDILPNARKKFRISKRHSLISGRGKSRVTPSRPKLIK